ncbi:hypothetical protein PG997_002632 [Apiospora hydei]|uniref:F-box domain-containing protein n=1 Tax=Apiospora hydei TaxID=1337664 RepID=A0ABR1WWZ0_9PEZI
MSAASTSALLNLPGEIANLIFSPSNCDPASRLALRVTSRALRAIVTPPSFNELVGLETRWAIAAQRDLFACCRCEMLRSRAAFADRMVDAATYRARGDTAARWRFCRRCVDELAERPPALGALEIWPARHPDVFLEVVNRSYARDGGRSDSEGGVWPRKMGLLRRS